MRPWAPRRRGGPAEDSSEAERDTPGAARDHGRGALAGRSGEAAALVGAGAVEDEAAREAAALGGGRVECARPPRMR
ncbi:hypothetical protein SCE1572_00945 [Sorangium cellulosum So0157-2]|uniref:Uncharacterized protein n=1 Tax=Sorangium cellulosum So0157-2 TaxID=1254432 RepID=S4XJ55_SORCE|nr:hypothetical protein SCE1572_00945 [Sorangium cellulosum So0157-2]